MWKWAFPHPFIPSPCVGSRKPSGVPRRSRPDLERIATGTHLLVSAPTGSGKTLAAFLWPWIGSSAAPGKERGRGSSTSPPSRHSIPTYARTSSSPSRGFRGFQGSRRRLPPGHRRGKERGHGTTGTEEAPLASAGHPHHHAREPEHPPLHAERPGPAGRSQARDPGRDPRDRGQQAGDPSDHRRGEARPSLRGIPADRDLRDHEPHGGDRPVSRRIATGNDPGRNRPPQARRRDCGRPGGKAYDIGVMAVLPPEFGRPPG